MCCLNIVSLHELSCMLYNFGLGSFFRYISGCSLHNMLLFLYYSYYIQTKLQKIKSLNVKPISQWIAYRDIGLLNAELISNKYLTNVNFIADWRHFFVGRCRVNFHLAPGVEKSYGYMKVLIQAEVSFVCLQIHPLTETMACKQKLRAELCQEHPNLVNQTRKLEACLVYLTGCDGVFVQKSSNYFYFAHFLW